MLAVLTSAVPHFDKPNTADKPVDTGDTAWVLASCAMVLIMTPGVAFFYGGMVDSKNIISTMYQSFVAMGLISVLWVIVGFSLAFGDTVGGVIGNPSTFFMCKSSRKRYCP
jgi:Amt family ammonium transporter